MKTFHAKLVALTVSTACLTMAPAAHAQGIPVMDVASIMQQIQQVISWGKQLEEMKNHLDQMKAQYNSLNGLRDIGGLLNNELLNQYLPKDYVQTLNDLRAGKGAWSGISGALNDIVSVNQLRTCAQSYTVKAAADACTKQWQDLAMNKKLGDIGYQQAAKNIDNLQSFVNSIKSSPDAKSLQDLAARISVEQVRMQNEQVKLQTIQMMQAADEKLKQQAAYDTFKTSLETGIRTVDF